MVEERGTSVSKPPDPLRHHGDVEVRGENLVDLAVNVYPGPPPDWLTAALHASLDDVGAYPSATSAEASIATHHRRTADEVLATAGAAEAFALVARLRPWRQPVVVHPQFTEPHAALEQAGHRVTPMILPPPYDLEPGLVPEDADLVMVGNPTNPTGVLHPAAAIRALIRPGRLVVVDEAFMDTVSGGTQTLTTGDLDGMVVIRSLTKHWGIPGVRAGYLLTAPDVVADLRRGQVPWSVSAAAAAAMSICCSTTAGAEADRRTRDLVAWRTHLETALDDLGIEHVASSSSFVLARVGLGVHARLREAGIAVRRCDTFPGLDDTWVRIAVRPPELTDRLLVALERLA